MNKLSNFQYGLRKLFFCLPFSVLSLSGYSQKEKVLTHFKVYAEPEYCSGITPPYPVDPIIVPPGDSSAIAEYERINEENRLKKEASALHFRKIAFFIYDSLVAEATTDHSGNFSILLPVKTEMQIYWKDCAFVPSECSGKIEEKKGLSGGAFGLLNYPYTYTQNEPCKITFIIPQPPCCNGIYPE